MPPTKPLFTLQHSSVSQSVTGNDVSSVCFLPKVANASQEPYVVHDEHEHEHSTCSDATSDDDSSDSDSELQFKSRQILTSPQHHYLQNEPDSTLVTHVRTRNTSTTTNPYAHISSARDTLASLSFSHTLLASTHASGYAYIWDLTSRRVIHTLHDGLGPGLALGRVSLGTDTDADAEASGLFHQRRNPEGSISILDPNTDYSIVRRMECQSQTFCHASTGASSSFPMRDLLLSPSRHSAFAQLWDLRMERSVGVVHGAKLDREDVSKWNDEGMLMSLDLCHDEGKCFVGCGMESGKVFFHDLRMLQGNANVNANGNDNIDCSMGNVRRQMREFKTKKDVIETEMCSVSLGKDPILCLDMCLSQQDAGANNRNSQSMVMIAGKAADAMELLDLPEEERGTVAVIKATSLRDDDDNVRMKARVRAKVGTCKVSGEVSREGKPGVGVCRFRPDGNVFAVGGWDKRVRIYSRTSAKLLSVLKGSNASVTALDWNKGNANDDFVLAAGSSDGKIAIWRPNIDKALTLG